MVLRCAQEGEVGVDESNILLGNLGQFDSEPMRLRVHI